MWVLPGSVGAVGKAFASHGRTSLRANILFFCEGHPHRTESAPDHGQLGSECQQPRKWTPAPQRLCLHRRSAPSPPGPGPLHPSPRTPDLPATPTPRPAPRLINRKLSAGTLCSLTFLFSFCSCASAP